MKKPTFSKKVTYGASAIAFTAIVIAAAILLNVAASLLTDRFNLKADMTADQRYDISDATVEMLKNVENDINVYMLAPEADVVDTDKTLGIYGPSIASILNRYPVLSDGKVKVEYVDIERNPSFTQGFQLGEIPQYSILVQSEAAYRLLTYYDYIYFRAADSFSEKKPVGLNLEHALASAIYYCDTGSRRNAVLLDGKGENNGRDGGEGSKLVSFLESNNFNVNYVNLTTETLPEDTDLIVICAPEKDYSPDEIAVIDSYLNRNLGKVIVSMGTESKDVSNLAYYLREYGLTITDQAIYDGSNSRTGHPEAVRVTPIASDVMESLTSIDTMLIFPNSLRMNTVDVAGTGWTKQDLLNTYDSAFTKTADLVRDPASVTRAPGDEAGVFSVATLLTRKPTTEISGDETSGKLLVLTSGDALSDVYFNSGSYTNWSFMSVLLSDFFGGNDLSAFKYKVFTDSELVTLEVDRQIILGVLIAIPVLLFAGGVVVWFRRKNL
ncbi:MAG: GldG family protein [Clostridia bacterium]|nr:GldG family protein [Clostridia bacterium]